MEVASRPRHAFAPAPLHPAGLGADLAGDPGLFRRGRRRAGRSMVVTSRARPEEFPWSRVADVLRAPSARLQVQMATAPDRAGDTDCRTDARSSARVLIDFRPDRPPQTAPGITSRWPERAHFPRRSRRARALRRDSIFLGDRPVEEQPPSALRTPVTRDRTEKSQSGRRTSRPGSAGPPARQRPRSRRTPRHRGEGQGLTPSCRRSWLVCGPGWRGMNHPP